MGRYLPGPAALGRYPRAWLGADLVAGVTLGCVMVPVGLAYGDLAGVPPVAGLYAAILPLVAYALVGSSRQLVIGPDASPAALVGALVAPPAAGDLARHALLAAAFAVLVGVACLIAGAARIGFMADFLPKQVLVGFTGGLGLTIVAGQLGKLTGIPVTATDPLPRLIEVARHLGQVHGPTLAVGAGTIGLVYACRRWTPRVPGQLVAMIAGILAVRLLGVDRLGVGTVGSLPGGLPAIEIPRIGVGDLVTLAPSAFAIALLAFSDTVLTARSFAARNRYRVDANQELFALGAGNIVAGLTQGLPVSGSGARTAVAEAAGARSQLSALVGAGVVVVALLALTPRPLEWLPSATLGGILVTAGLRLIEPYEFVRLWRVRAQGFLLAVLTLAGVVGIGVLQGILLAVGVACVMVAHRLARPPDAVLGRMEVGGHFVDLQEEPEARPIAGLLVYRVEAPLFFLNADFVRSRIESLLRDTQPAPEWVLVDARVILDIDLTAVEMLGELRDGLAASGVELAVAGANDRVLEQLRRGGALDRLGSDRVFRRLADGVAAFESRPGRGDARVAPATSRPGPERVVSDGRGRSGEGARPEAEGWRDRSTRALEGGQEAAFGRDVVRWRGAGRSDGANVWTARLMAPRDVESASPKSCAVRRTTLQRTENQA